MNHGLSIVAMLALACAVGAVSDREEPAVRLGMTTAVACKTIEGYEQFVPLPDAALTSEDKLKVYYRPINYQIEHTKTYYKAHFIQEGRVRRRDDKVVLWKKENLLDYEPKSPTPPYQIYLTNTIGLKGLPPGDYDLDIILHDGLAKNATATQVLHFKVIPIPKSATDERVE